MRNCFSGLIYFLEQEPESPEIQKKAIQQNISKTMDPGIPGSVQQDIPGVEKGVPTDPSADPAAGMLPEEEPLDFTDIGKVFVLKKIYVKLLSIDNMLKNFTDEKYINLKNDVQEVIDMFHTVVSNIDKVKDDMDNYIKLFQDFTLNTVKKLDSINNKED